MATAVSGVVLRRFLHCWLQRLTCGLLFSSMCTESSLQDLMKSALKLPQLTQLSQSTRCLNQL